MLKKTFPPKLLSSEAIIYYLEFRANETNRDLLQFRRRSELNRIKNKQNKWMMKMGKGRHTMMNKVSCHRTATNIDIKLTTFNVDSTVIQLLSAKHGFGEKFDIINSWKKYFAFVLDQNAESECTNEHHYPQNEHILNSFSTSWHISWQCKFKNANDHSNNFAKCKTRAKIAHKLSKMWYELSTVFYSISGNFVEILYECCP